jgi:hypothetical protein
MINNKVLTKEGYNYLGYNHFFFAPGITFLTVINDIIVNNSISFLKNMVMEIGEKDAYLIYKYLMDNNLNNKNILSEFAIFITYMGFGKISLFRVTKKQIIFSHDDLIFKDLYFKMFGKKPIFYFIELFTGVIKYFLSIYYKKKVNVKFILVDGNCYFRCDLSDENYTYLCDTEINFPKNFEILKSEEFNRYNLKCSGVNYLNGFLVMILPTYLYFDLIEKAGWSHNIKLNSGESMGKLTYGKLVDKKLSKIDNFKYLNYLISSFGIGKIIFLDKSYMKISILNNFKNYSNPKNLNLLNIKYFIALMYKGFYDSVNNVTTRFEISGDIVTYFKVSDECDVSDVNLKLFKNVKMKL